MSEMNHLLKPDGSKIFSRKIEDDHILGVKSNIVILGGNEHSQLPQLPAIFGAHQGSKDPWPQRTKGPRDCVSGTHFFAARIRSSLTWEIHGGFMVDSWGIQMEHSWDIRG